MKGGPDRQTDSIYQQTISNDRDGLSRVRPFLVLVILFFRPRVEQLQRVR